MASDIYDQHETAFQTVSAYCVLKDGKLVARIAFKHPPRGHGERRLWAYVHWLGVPMVRGSAGGCGYDKKTAACAVAARLLPDILQNSADWSPDTAFKAALENDTGYDWDRQLREAGFEVLQAV